MSQEMFYILFFILCLYTSNSDELSSEILTFVFRLWKTKDTKVDSYTQKYIQHLILYSKISYTKVIQSLSLTSFIPRFQQSNVTIPEQQSSTVFYRILLAQNKSIFNLSSFKMAFFPSSLI